MTARAMNWAGLSKRRKLFDGRFGQSPWVAHEPLAFGVVVQEGEHAVAEQVHRRLVASEHDGDGELDDLRAR